MNTKKHRHFTTLNRELSWLAFNKRVLQEAQDPGNPLVSRIHFLGIFSNNLDEFFRVRVASLERAKKQRSHRLDPMDFNPSHTLHQIHETVVDLQEEFDRTFVFLQKELKTQHILFVTDKELNKEQKTWAVNFFENEIRPHLVPLLIQDKIPFPELKDGALYFVVEMTHPDTTKKSHAILEIPQNLPRFIVVPDKSKKLIIFLDDLIRLCLSRTFTALNCSNIKAFEFKVTRDAELEIESDLTLSFVEKMEKSLTQRKSGRYVRLNFDAEIPLHLHDFLVKNLKIKNPENLIPGGKYHNKKDLIQFPHFSNDALIFKKPLLAKHEKFQHSVSHLNTIQEQDILLHFPYHDFNQIIEVLREAAIDPDVKTIRITLYRVAKNSLLLNALANAAQNGKKVIAVVEVQARFDEEHNIQSIQILQEAGVKVIPGVLGLKVHSKIFLITRKRKGKTTRIAHIGTGNFHEKTAKIYSDISLLTANKVITDETRKLFDFFESNYTRDSSKHLLISPFNLRKKLVDFLDQEIHNAKKGKDAWIKIKCNSLVDEPLIQKLYQASNAGVKIDLIIRGICCLDPQKEKQSENIHAISIVGQYLEHARVFIFCNNNKPLYFISSADWMTRNLDHRIEVTVPILDPTLQQEINHFIQIQIDPNEKQRSLADDQTEYAQLDELNLKNPQTEWSRFIELKSKSKRKK